MSNFDEFINKTKNMNFDDMISLSLIHISEPTRH